MKKLSIRHLRVVKISKRAKPNTNRLIEEMRAEVKKDPIIIKKFKEYGVPLDDIDKVYIEFADLDVSAKTKDRKIYLNQVMLEDDSPTQEPTHYLVHELIHYLQQTTGKNLDHSDAEDYLDKDSEQEAFKAQVDYKKREESPEEAVGYVERLLDHHDIEGKERKEKKKDLLE